MKLVGYVRVSSTGQLDGFGPDAQRRAIRAWARANGHKVAHWCEDAITGAAEAIDRPGFACVVDHIVGKDADGVIVARLDRLARALTTQEAALALLWKLGATVFTADAGQVLEDDPDDPMRTAIRQVFGVFAELDRKLVTKRLRDGRSAKAATGRKAVGAYAYGYRGVGKGRDRDAGPDQSEQRAVDRIKELRKAGQSYREIAVTLDAEGFKPRRAASWSAMSVRQLVSDERPQRRPSGQGPGGLGGRCTAGTSSRPARTRADREVRRRPGKPACGGVGLRLAGALPSPGEMVTRCVFAREAEAKAIWQTPKT